MVNAYGNTLDMIKPLITKKPSLKDEEKLTPKKFSIAIEKTKNLI